MALQQLGADGSLCWTRSIICRAGVIMEMARNLRRGQGHGKGGTRRNRWRPATSPDNGNP